MLRSSNLKLFPVFLVAYELISYLSIDAYLPAMPIIAQQFKVSDSLVQLTLTVIFLGNVFAQLLLGWISEQYSRRKILLWGGAVFVISSFMAAFSPGIEVLIFARFLQGMAITSLIIAGYSTIHVLYDQEQAVKIIAWMGSITVFAPAVGPILGAFIMKLASWRWIFLILSLAASFCLIYLYKIMPETASQDGHKSNFILLIKKYLKTTFNPRFLRPASVWCLLFAGMTAWSICGPFFVISYLKYNPIAFGVVQGLIFAFFILGTRCIGWLLKRYSLKGIATLCSIIVLISGFLAILFSLLKIFTLVSLIATLLPLIFTLGIGFPVFSRLAVESNDESVMIKVSLYSLLLNISSFFMGVIALSLLENKFSFLLVIAILAFSSFALSFYKLPFEKAGGAEK